MVAAAGSGIQDYAVRSLETKRLGVFFFSASQITGYGSHHRRIPPASHFLFRAVAASERRSRSPKDNTHCPIPLHPLSLQPRWFYQFKRRYNLTSGAPTLAAAHRGRMLPLRPPLAAPAPTQGDAQARRMYARGEIDQPRRQRHWVAQTVGSEPRTTETASTPASPSGERCILDMFPAAVP